MKKLIVLFGAAVLALSSCQKESPVIEETFEVPETPAISITYKLDATHPDGAATKAVKTDWETGDVIFVFFSGSAAPGYLEMKWNGSQWNYTEKNNLTIQDNQTGTMHAVYQPFGNDNQVVADVYGRWRFRDIHFCYYLQDTQSYTITDGQVSGTFNMSIPEGFVQFFLDDPDADSSQEMELREPNLTPLGVFNVHPTLGPGAAVTDDGAPLTGYVYDKENKASGEQKGWLFSGVLQNSARGVETDYHFTLVKGGWQGVYYQKSFLNKQYYTGPSERRALKIPVLSTWTEVTEHKPIDLGTSIWGEFKRIYWSSRNLGASADIPAEDSDAARKATWGDYYAWGVTEPHYLEGHAYDNPCNDWKTGMEMYAWKSYPFSGDHGRSIFKYTIPDGEDDADWYDSFGQFIGDNKTVLEKDDDAASKALKGTWRMPGSDEWALLMDEASFSRTYDSGKQGVILTSKIPGYEGRSIFLPLAGYRSFANLEKGEQYGRYWTCSLNADPQDGRTTEAKLMEVSHYPSMGIIMWQRYDGCSIRPVCN